ncbi:MAG: sugar ABC transporter ATP-binding protein [Candidatus Atribacteria bacterium]|nr:sugar ABC transporter ATP-binding protein [Candidatus Atribacteria bacterium]
MDENQPLLKIVNVSKSFPGVRALDKVNMALISGEVHALVGENGAGKSTLVKIISGAYIPDEGSIDIGDKSFRSLNPYQARLNGIATVYQEQQLVPWLSVAENIFLGMEPRTRWGSIDFLAMKQQAEGRIRSYGLSIQPNDLVAALSVAARQEVAILKVLARQAKVLLLDEPTASLTGSQVDFLFHLIHQLQQQGIGILYISHYLDEVLEIAQRITVLRNGQCVGTFQKGSLTKETLIEKMAGHKLDSSAVVKKPIGEKILELKDISCKNLLQKVNLSLHKEEILGILGGNDSGCHELIRLLAGLLPFSQGKMFLKGEPYSPNSIYDALEKGLFFIPENMRKEGLVLPLSLAKNITLSNLKEILTQGFIHLKKEGDQAQNLVKALKIVTPSVKTEVQYLSGGNQRKVLFAKALFANAQIWLLEEPTQGVDVEARQEIHRLLFDIKSKQKSILLVSSDLEELITVADRIIILRRGQIVEEITDLSSTSPKELLQAMLGG